MLKRLLYPFFRKMLIEAWQKNAIHRRKQIIAILNVYKYGELTCELCKKKIKRNATIDHKIPLSKGGTHKFSNLQMMHYQCNQKKGNEIL